MVMVSRRLLIACVECGDEWGVESSVEGFICPICSVPKMENDVEIYDYNIACVEDVLWTKTNKAEWYLERYRWLRDNTYDTPQARVGREEYLNDYYEAKGIETDIRELLETLQEERELLIKPISLWREDNVKVA